MEFLHTGEDSFDIVDEAQNSELLLYRLWLPKERMVGATCGVAEVCKAFENFVELEQERIWTASETKAWNFGSVATSGLTLK